MPQSVFFVMGFLELENYDHEQYAVAAYPYKEQAEWHAAAATGWIKQNPFPYLTYDEAQNRIPEFTNPYDIRHNCYTHQHGSTSWSVQEVKFYGGFDEYQEERNIV
jgi:hypothetical protein